MTAKLRMTLWFTLMVLLLSVLVLVFVLVVNSRSLPEDPARYLVAVVMDNAADVEFDNGRFDWHDLDVCRRGVFCSFYNKDGELLLSANREDMDVSAFPLRPNILRTVTLAAGDYYLYDTYVDMEFTGLWVRGVVSTSNATGVMHTILVLTLTLLPLLLVLTFAGGWFIAWLNFRPLEKIMDAAESISDGEDLSARIGLKRGPQEFRRLSAAFDHMFERLERSFHSERQFASDASHELRTPATVILAECDRARRKNRSPEDYRRSLAVIEEQGKRMSELIAQLLSLTRMQQGTERFPMRETDLSTLTVSCCEEFPIDPNKGIRFTREIEDGIRAKVNATLYSRVIFNLLQNACKYGRENGEIRLSLHRADGFAVLRVADDGIGIAPEDQEKIWQRFWQADTSRGEDGGSGLGLAMVKEITAFHGGTVSVESAPGRGSTFTVRLPAE